MSKEKQIEEMARAICPCIYGHYGCESCDLYDNECCLPFNIARALEDKGYRKLPCKIGDKVWAIRNFSGRTQAVEGKVSEMYFIEEMRLTIVVKNVARGQWGKKIFATREECEQAIKENKERLWNTAT